MPNPSHRSGLKAVRSACQSSRAHSGRPRCAWQDDDGYLDEVAGYVLAAAGFYMQYCWGFAMPFPLNVVLFPFTMVEYYIRWTITSPA